MKKNNLILSLLVTGAAFAFSGCASATELTDQESDIIATYAANVLMNNDANYQDKLVVATGAAAQVTPTPAPVTPADTVTPVTTTAPGETITTNPASTAATTDGQGMPDNQTAPDASPQPQETGTEMSLTDVIHTTGFQVDYTGYEFCKQYPKSNSAYGVSASEDELLLVVKFRVTNTTNKKKKIDLINRQISYPLTADSTDYNPTISVLENGGLNFLSTTIGGGKSETAVIIYALPLSAKSKSNFTITARDGDNYNKISLK